MKKTKWGVIGTAGIARSCTIPGMLQAEKKTIEVPQNYRLEIEEFGRCIAENEMPVVTEEFSVKNARLVDRILKEIGY